MPSNRPLSRALYRLAGIPETVDTKTALEAFAQLVGASPPPERPPGRAGRVRALLEPFPKGRRG